MQVEFEHFDYGPVDMEGLQPMFVIVEGDLVHGACCVVEGVPSAVFMQDSQ